MQSRHESLINIVWWQESSFCSPFGPGCLTYFIPQFLEAFLIVPEDTATASSSLLTRIYIPYLTPQDQGVLLGTEKFDNSLGNLDLICVVE